MTDCLTQTTRGAALTLRMALPHKQLAKQLVQKVCWRQPVTTKTATFDEVRALSLRNTILAPGATHLAVSCRQV